MFNISQYLEKFKSIGLKESEAKEFLIEAVFSQAGVMITRQNVGIRSGIATIKGHALLRNQIQIKKEKILRAVGVKTDKIKDLR